MWPVLAFLGLFLAAGCQRSVPVLDVGPKPATIAQGTISGTIRGPEGSSPVSGRTVEIVNIATGQRHSTTTSPSGDFRSQLPAGKYRLEPALRDGETVVARPDVVSLDGADIDPHVEIVLGATRVLRPRGPAYRVENGLGAPSA